MRIGLITTINTNIGDDLIREGICLVLRQIFGGREIEFVEINKHQPLTVYPNWHPVHLARHTRRVPRVGLLTSSLIEGFAAKLGLSRFHTCDLIVQCGAPVLWPLCHRCEWAKPLWHHLVGRLSHSIPILNLAAGSCYPWERQPDAIINPEDESYLRAILDYCRVTTVRDTLAQHLCASMGVETPLIPCSAFLAAGNGTSGAQHDGIVLINYMPGGGHYDWNQGIDDSMWRETVKSLIDRLRKRHQLVFLCHNESEYLIARDLDPTLPLLLPKNPKDYFKQVSVASVALCNRLHASVALASLGIPSIAVGTDTRLLMVEALGLPCLYVKEANVDQLEWGIESLLANHHLEKERLLALRSATCNEYVAVVEDSVHR
jgi:hypothetical protein